MPVLSFLGTKVCLNYESVELIWLDALCNALFVIAGGVRMAEDFYKAMALYANAIALSNLEMHVLRFIAPRIYSSNNCPVGVATQKPE